MSSSIPNGWSMCTIGDLLLDARPGFACGDDVEEGVIQFRMNNVTREGLIDWSKVRRIPADTKNLDQFLVAPGDLLFNHTNSPDLVGKCAIFYGHEEPIAYSNHFLRLRLNSKKAESRFLLRWIAYLWAHGKFKGMCKQWVNQATVSKDQFLALQIPLPPLSDQRRIAAILDQAEALRSMRRAALAKIDTLAQSLFIETLECEESKNWTLVKLHQIADIITGYAFKSEEYVFSEDAIKLCRGTNVLPGRIDWSDLARWPMEKAEEVQEFSLLPGDIVMAMDRPWIAEGFKIARIAHKDCPSLLVQRVARIRGKNGVSNEFLFGLLNQPAFTRYCRPTETTIPHISPKEIRSFGLRLPPLALQHEFTKRISKLGEVREGVLRSVAHFEALFASLQHRAFRGEL